jgi:2-polyprenyl-3-methyl-5-hydroxy-6-metoxy-1,4-benzoquinol methylase
MSAHDLIEHTYAALHEEFASRVYTDREYAMLADEVFYYGRYLDSRTRRYALHTLVPNLSMAIEHLELCRGSGVRVIDLGCGLGMQSLIFAQLGAEVVGIDLDPSCIELCRKRQWFFERTLRRRLPITFVAGDFQKLDTTQLSDGYEGMFSMSAFAHIPPVDATVKRIAALLAPEARVAIWDKNPDWLFLNHFGASASLPRPERVASEFARHGFTTDVMTGGAAVPRHLWSWTPAAPVIGRLDAIAKRSLRLSFNYLFLATRHAAVALAS